MCYNETNCIYNGAFGRCYFLIVETAWIVDLMKDNNALQNEKIALLNTVEDLENREIVTVEFVEEKKVEKPIAIKLNNRYNMIEDERELFARLLYCEGGNESVECQRAIASVVLNRLHSGKWGDSLTSVIYATGQFQPISSGAILTAKPSQTQYDVIDYVNENGCTIPSWVMFFRASYHFNWKNYTPYCQIDNTFFGGYNNE